MEAAPLPSSRVMRKGSRRSHGDDKSDSASDSHVPEEEAAAAAALPPAPPCVPSAPLAREPHAPPDMTGASAISQPGDRMHHRSHVSHDARIRRPHLGSPSASGNLGPGASQPAADSDSEGSSQRPLQRHHSPPRSTSSRLHRQIRHKHGSSSPMSSPSDESSGDSTPEPVAHTSSRRRSSTWRAHRSGMRWWNMIMLVQLMCSLMLIAFLILSLRPLQLRLDLTLRELDSRLERPPLMQIPRSPLARASAQPMCLWRQTHASGNTPSRHPTSSSRPLLLFAAAEASELVDSSASTSDLFAPRGSDTEFDIFSSEHLSNQYIVVLRDEVRQRGSDSSPPSGSFREATSALLSAHKRHLRLIAEFPTLPGFACVIQAGTLAEEPDYGGSGGSRQAVAGVHTLSSLLAALRSHPSVLFVSRDRPLSIGVSSAVALQSGSTVPPGVRRVQAATLSTVSSPASVGVAVLDTGIDLNHKGLNAKNGINCIRKIERLMRGTGMREESGSGRNRTDELAEREWMSRVAGSWDTAHLDDLLTPDLAMDDNNHGTHVAGIIGGLNVGNSVVGVAPGTPVCRDTARTYACAVKQNPVSWRSHAVKILNSHGQGSFAHLLCGINWVTESAERLNIKIASMSLAGTGLSDDACGERNYDPLHKAICHATNEGILFIAAAGNSAEDLAGVVPAAYPEVLTVTAMADSDGLPGGLGPPLTCRGWEDDDHAASFSNYALMPAEPEQALPSNRGKDPREWAGGPPSPRPFNPDWAVSPLLHGEEGGRHTLPVETHVVSAPGACILSTIPGGRYAALSGTSQACPHVSGVVALAYGSRDSLGPCHLLPPLLCMRWVIARAHALELESEGAYGFLTWTTQRATKPGHWAGTDELIVGWRQGSANTGAHAKRNPRTGKRGDDEFEDEFEVPEIGIDAEMVRSMGEEGGRRVVAPGRPGVRMRKYYGPLIVARLP